MANEAGPGFKGLRLHNTLTREKQDFVPLDPANVRMYVCGPTVYDFAHIGNARPIIVFDVLFRLLRHLYGEDHVTYVRNITDVDDKIIARSAEQYPDLPLNQAIGKLTEETERQFHADVAALGCLEPSVEPRATEHIGEMKTMIEGLIEKGCAYVAEEHVLFRVAAMKDYGRLSNRSVDEMIAGARVEVAPYKQDPMDFVLWKPSKPGEPAWPSPAGIGTPGRPGWHLECSAMSDRWLWEEARAGLTQAGLAHPHEFDIHGGGVDLVFPHHENEIAQSRCCFGTGMMARYWLHNGYLQVEGRKMSKSLGNFVTVRELLDGWEGYSWPGEALRFNMLRTHYRQPLDWTLAGLDESHKILWDWCGQIGDMRAATDIPEPVIEAVSDDLNTPKAIAEMHKMASEGRYEELLSALRSLGFSGEREKIFRRVEPGRTVTIRPELFVERDQFPSAQVINHDEVQRLVDLRKAARLARNFEEADRIRDELAAMGIQLKDSKDPKTGEMVTIWEIAR